MLLVGGSTRMAGKRVNLNFEISLLQICQILQYLDPVHCAILFIDTLMQSAVCYNFLKCRIRKKSRFWLRAVLELYL